MNVGSPGAGRDDLQVMVFFIRIEWKEEEEEKKNYIQWLRCARAHTLVQRSPGARKRAGVEKKNAYTMSSLFSSPPAHGFCFHSARQAFIIIYYTLETSDDDNRRTESACALRIYAKANTQLKRRHPEKDITRRGCCGRRWGVRSGIEVFLRRERHSPG